MYINRLISRLQGIGGALSGALIGMLSIIIFFELGVLSACSGFILAISTYYGYALFAREQSKMGISFCLLLNLVTPIPAILLLHSFSRSGMDVMILKMMGIYCFAILGSVAARAKSIASLNEIRSGRC
mgnify:CR=1 FL=1